MNKTLILLVSLCIIILACKKPYPEDLAGKKSLLSEKKLERNNIQEEIDKLIEEIDLLEPKKKKNSVLVTVDTLESTLFKQFVEVQAIVAAEDYVNASSETGGRLTNLYVNEGDYVSKGKLVGSVDLESMEIQLQELKTAYSLAETVFNRQKRLWEQNIGSEIQYLESKNNKERLEKNMQNIESNLRKKNIYAPISGFVDREFIQAGEMTSPGSPIVSILNTSKVKVVADLPEKYLGTVKKGDKVTVSYPALNEKIESRITLLGRSIDPSNRTFKVEISASNTTGKLKPNLLAKVMLNNYSNADALVVPSDLVLKDVNNNQFVYIAKEDKGVFAAKQRLVYIGESYDNKIEILEGLNPGDLLVIDGSRSLVDGTPLKIATSK